MKEKRKVNKTNATFVGRSAVPNHHSYAAFNDFSLSPLVNNHLRQPPRHCLLSVSSCSHLLLHIDDLLTVAQLFGVFN